jgi:hypothetical protein
VILLALVAMNHAAAATAPSVTSLTPNSGDPAGGTQVTINGSGFASGAAVTFDGLSATSVLVINAVHLTCVTPPHAAGAVNVTVTNPDTQTGTLANGFTYGVPVVVTSISPADGTTNGGTLLTINGVNFATGATVTIGGTQATGVTFISTAQLSCISPAHAGAGAFDVVVTDSGTNSSTLPSGFTYDLAPPPSIDNITPNHGSSNGGTAVAINGSHFAKGATVTFGSSPTTGVTFNSSEQLLCTTPASVIGAQFANITVTNPDSQSFTLSGGFSYVVVPAPLVTSIAPNKGTANGGTLVRIRGDHFVSGAAVVFGGTSVSATFVTSKRLTCVTPANSSGAGFVIVEVINPDQGAGRLNNAFLYKLLHRPTMDTITPDTGSAVGGTTVTINGGHYVSGTTVTFAGIVASNVKIVSAKQLTCITPVNPAGAGVFPVVVTNPDGQSSTRVKGFNYTLQPAPVVSTINPNAGTAAGGTSVTITGSNFVNGVTVTFGGVSASSINVLGETQLSCITPPFSAGKVDVVVTNSDAQSGTLNGGFTYFTVP